MRFRSINNDSIYFISKTTGFVQSAFFDTTNLFYPVSKQIVKYHAVKIDP